MPPRPRRYRRNDLTAPVAVLVTGGVDELSHYLARAPLRNSGYLSSNASGNESISEDFLKGNKGANLFSAGSANSASKRLRENMAFEVIRSFRLKPQTG